MDTHSSHTIEVNIDADGWDQAVGDTEALCRRVALAALLEPGRDLPATCAVDILLSDDAAVRALNKAWRGQDKATNVLSFPAWAPGDPVPPGEPVLLGDIVLARETVLREAVEQAKPVAEHLAHLVVHGVLHLAGHDHEVEDEAEAMERLERYILQGLGIADPYAAEAA